MKYISGKSTFVMSLLRLVKGESGDIYIDGVNIAELGLHELRTRISVVPQAISLFHFHFMDNFLFFE